MGKLYCKYEKTGTGFSAWAEGYPIYTTGGMWAELESNMVEVSNIYFEAVESDRRVTVDDLEFEEREKD
jgi:hypothetical protein